MRRHVSARPIRPRHPRKAARVVHAGGHLTITNNESGENSRRREEYSIYTENSIFSRHLATEWLEIFPIGLSVIMPAPHKKWQSAFEDACTDRDKGLPGVVGVAGGRDGKELLGHAAGKRDFGSEEPTS